MKVILLEDVKNLGRKFEVHEVADGYGTNFLIPQGKARVATDAVVAEFEEKMRQAEEERAARREAMKEALAELAGTEVKLVRKANEQGQLFAGVNAEDISEVLERDHDVKLEEDYITVEPALKKVGEHEVEVILEDESVNLMVVIEAEEGSNDASVDVDDDEEADEEASASDPESEGEEDVEEDEN